MLPWPQGCPQKLNGGEKAGCRSGRTAGRARQSGSEGSVRAGREMPGKPGASGQLEGLADEQWARVRSAEAGREERLRTLPSSLGPDEPLNSSMSGLRLAGS